MTKDTIDPPPLKDCDFCDFVGTPKEIEQHKEGTHYISKEVNEGEKDITVISELGEEFLHKIIDVGIEYMTKGLSITEVIGELEICKLNMYSMVKDDDLKLKAEGENDKASSS